MNRAATFLLPIFGTLIVGCGTDHFTMEDFSRVEKIDAHVHINSMASTLVDVARATNFELLTINVDSPEFPPIDEQRRVAVSYRRAERSRVAFAATFTMKGWDGEGWEEATLRSLDEAVSQGAVAVKVWKNIGMAFRDKEGALVMIDDPRFDPIFRHLHEEGIVIIGHQGEPKDCWLPIDSMMVNNDKKYFKEYPQYYMYLHPEMPSYEEQMAARDRMLERNRDVQFIGAHLASLEWSVDELSRFLDRFPNAVVDMAARMGQLQYQSSRDREKVRDFLIEYQDRILYATDLTQQPDTNAEDFGKEVRDRWLADWRYLNTDATMTVPQLDDAFEGLALPKGVIEKIYRLNAERVFPTAWKDHE